MGIWQIFAVVGLGFLILEMTIPSMFFLNFAIAAFITAVCAIYIPQITPLIIIFVGISLLSLLFLRPFLVKTRTHKDQETGLNSKYIGQIAKVEKNITPNSGVISIYGERWEARCEGLIPEGSEVVIDKNISLVMYVSEIERK